MAPTPEELAAEAKGLPTAVEAPGEPSANRVVISGMSGIYPQMQHIKDLSEALYNKVNIFEEPNSRWVFDNPEVPPYVGLVPHLDRFDAQFFKVHYHLCCSMDSMARKVLEHSYQAIYDAGVNPESFSGKKVGVYIGSCLSETEKATFYIATNRNGFGIAGCNKSMFANRISYWLNAKGPSQAIDASCCSSTVALEQAYLAMTRGDCEAAIVAGANVCLHPQTSFHYGRTIPLCKDGKTKSYDQSADGCVRSEAINVLFLQKASDAVRIYADLVHVKNSFVPIKTIETGQKYGFCREVNVMSDFLKEFYEEAKVSPSEVEYVEGFGSGDGEADKNELEAYDAFFCKNRSEPLPVGSVLSNVGYCEAASGITAVTKVLLGFHKGEVAGNLHCDTPRTDVRGLREGRLQIVTAHRPIQRTYVGVNGLSITGLNSHILLHGHYKPKDLTKFECNIPRIVLLTARQDSAVKNVISDLKSRPIDPEELALLQNIHSSKISGHLGRGYVLLDTDKENKTVSVSERADYFDGSDRPLWFVYSGMGSQWAGMGAQLMRIPIFAAAIERCRQALEPKGIDIVHIITTPEKTIYDNILHSFVGIAAVQIGLTDILHALGLVPDKIIGHSVGELGCAYADGCLTAEEMILSAYSRGLVSIQTPFIKGSMAAVGVGFEEVSKLCPPEIEVACHNGPDSSTISGPAEAMAEFVAQLTAKGIFAKEVPCSNIAYHSRYIADAGPGLLKYLNEVIVTPKLRSEKWVSTSVPQERWTEESAKYSSAEYHTNNLLSPVLFEETSRLVPSNAVLVEVAPHGLLQAILKRSLPQTCANVPLTRRGHADNARFLLEAIGNIYMEGYYPDVRALYPKVQFPVSTGTPHLSHLVEWAHNETWPLPLYAGAKRKSTASCTFIISVHDLEHTYLQENIIQGKARYPFAGALVAAWDTLAMTQGAARRQLSVQFRDVQLFAQPALFDSRQLRLTVSLHRGTGLFEISDDNTKIASGYINDEKINYSEDYFLKYEKETGDVMLNSNDVYQIFSDRSYTYGREFRSIYDTNGSFTKGRLQWAGNWVTLLDGALQLNALRQPHDGVSQPVYIRNMTIDTDIISKMTKEDGQQLLEFDICPLKDYTRCGGIVLENVKFRHIPSSDEEKLQLKALQFVPRFSDRPDSKGELGGDYFVPVSGKLVVNNALSLNISRPGDLDSLHWVERIKNISSGIPVKVHFAGINACDIMKANGEIAFDKGIDNNETYLGMDFSGMTKSGQRVMGVVRDGALSERVEAQPELLWPVPEHWSLEDAATVPLPYAQAYYCLTVKYQLLPGMKVLVSGGAGGLGQAVISLALHLECTVFVVVSNVLKKRFLLKLFPQLKADHVMTTRDSFEDAVLILTSGYGCDVVICGKSDYKNGYLACCSSHGITIDYDQVKRNNNFMFGMSYLTNERTYAHVDFSSLFRNNDFKVMKEIQNFIAEGIISGAVRPLSRVSFAADEVARAFRLLTASRHRGRVLLRLQATLPPPAQPRIACSPDHCQLLVCDDEGLTINLADRLIKRGAKKLHLHSTTFSSRFNLALESWRKSYVNVTTSAEDLTVSETAINLVHASLRMGPMEGVFIAIHGNHTFIEKLDAATRKLCPALKFFAVIGKKSITEEVVCLSREKDGFPAMFLSFLENHKADGNSNIVRSVKNREVINAVERGLRTGQPVLYAMESTAKEMSLLQQIIATASIHISKDTPETTTLQNLGITRDNAHELAVLLRVKRGVVIDEEHIPFLTIQRIREIEESLKESDFTRKQGLSAIFSFVDRDELEATCEMVCLPTYNSSNKKRDDEFDSSQTFLCILPGLEGHHHRFRLMCERLKLSAFVMQPGLDYPNESIDEMTERFVKTYLKKIGEKQFYLLGYEMGVFTALKMAAILEDKGLSGTVFCLGGGPDEWLVELEAQLREAGGSKEQALQDAVARHMCTLMGGGDCAQLEAALREAPAWRQKVEASVRALRSRVPHSGQYARALIEAAYMRVTQARHHARERAQAAPHALRSRVVLLRCPGAQAAAPHPLQRYSSQPLAVHDLRAPLSRAPDDLRVAAIINQYLDDETLNEFENKNLCHTYLLNPLDFVGKTEKA